jgi:opacity protein-like surface antigen
MRKLVPMLLFLALALPLVAQENAGEVSKVEVFGGYSLLRDGGVNFNGWNGEVTGNLNQWFGITADIGGNYHRESVTAGGQTVSTDVNTYRYVFGPTVFLRSDRYTIFAHSLFGGARESAGVSGSVPDMSFTGNVFSLAFGGGLDYNVNKNFAVRVGQFDVFADHASSRWNKAGRYSAGLVFRF